LPVCIVAFEKAPVRRGFFVDRYVAICAANFVNEAKCRLRDQSISHKDIFIC
jgi:hypothetical protein